MVGTGCGRSRRAAKPAADDVLKVWPVSKQVNSPRNDGADLLEEVGFHRWRPATLGL
jgi:putative SOS response-associated peptidase YedK